MPGDDENVRIRAELEDAVSRPAENAADSLEDLEHAALKAAAAMEAADREAEALGDELRGLGRDTDKAARAQEQQARAAKQGRDEMGRFTEGTKKSRFEVKKFLKVGFGLSKFFKAIKWFAIADGINLAASGLGALGAGAFAAIAGLAPLSGLLVAYPGLLIAGAQGMVAFKMGTKGVGEAIKVLADPKASPEALAEALKDLTPNARKFAVEVASLNKEGKKLRQNIQQKMFAGLSKEVAPLGKLYFPILNRTMGATAGALNNVGKGVAIFLKLKTTSAAVSTLLGSNASIIQNLGHGSIGLFGSLLHLLVAASPMLREMSADFKEFGIGLDGIVQKNSGKLQQFFLNSYDLAKQVVSVLVDIFKGFYNIGKLAMPLAGDMGEATANIAENFKKWTESEAGRKKIQDFFAYAKPVLWEISKLIWAVVKGLGSISMSPSLVPTLQTLRTEILPAILGFIQQSDGQIIPTLLEIAKSFLSLATNLNIMGPTVEILKLLAAAFGWLAEKVNNMSAGEKQFLAWVITAGLFVKMGFNILVFVRQFLPAGASFIKILKAIGTGIMFVGRALLALVIANPVVAAIVLVIAILVIMYFKFDWFRNFVNSVWHGIATVAIAVWTWIQMAAQKFWGWIGPVVLAAVNLIVAYVKLVWAWWNLIWQAIRLIALVIIAAIVIFVRQKIAEFKAIFALISAAWKWVWDKIGPYITPILKWIGEQVKSRIDGMKIVIGKVYDFFKEAFDKVKGYVMPIIDAITTAIGKITDAVGKISGGLKGAGDAVGGFIKDNVPFLAKGGALGAGTTAITGERGPEAFVSRTGNVKMLGLNGPEAYKPNLSGYVVPNHALKGEKDSGTPEWALRALSTHRASKATDDPSYGPKKPPRDGPGDGGTKVAQRPINIQATVRSEADIKKLAAEIRRQDRDDEERGY